MLGNVQLYPRFTWGWVATWHENFPDGVRCPAPTPEQANATYVLLDGTCPPNVGEGNIGCGNKVQPTDLPDICVLTLKSCFTHFHWQVVEYRYTSEALLRRCKLLSVLRANKTRQETGLSCLGTDMQRWCLQGNHNVGAFCDVAQHSNFSIALVPFSAPMLL